MPVDQYQSMDALGGICLVHILTSTILIERLRQKNPLVNCGVK
jgi:hypothetical protein